MEIKLVAPIARKIGSIPVPAAKRNAGLPSLGEGLLSIGTGAE